MRRRLVQVASALLANAQLGNFLRGRIYQGPLKQVCVPFLNCYSCPGALGSCPLGALQSLAAPPVARISAYVLGGMLVAGGIAGRFMCGWLCPFGLAQDLLAGASRRKLPFPRPLRYLKFILLPLVVILPLVWLDSFGYGRPYFCQYICPAGTLTAGLPLLMARGELWPLAGWVFWWKAALLVLILVAAAVLYYRPFCRALCPLGAFWGLFNRLALFRLHAGSSCTQCGECRRACPVELPLPAAANSGECIRCLACVKGCPRGALTFRKAF